MNKIWLLLIVLSSEAFAGPPLSAIEWLQTSEPPIVADPVKPASKIVDIARPYQTAEHRSMISVSPLSRLSLPKRSAYFPAMLPAFPEIYGSTARQSFWQD